MLRHILCGLFTLAALSIHAQNDVTHQSVSLDGVKHVSIYASFSSIVLSEGTRNEIEVEHSVIINDKQEAMLHELSIKKSGSILEVRELSPTFSELEKRFPKGFSAQDNHYNGSVNSPPKTTIESFLKLKIPAGVTVEVETEYGSIHAKNVAGLKKAYAEYGAITVILAAKSKVTDLDFHSHYGAVDVTLAKNAGADLQLLTEYGELYSDFDIKVNADRRKEDDFLQQLVAVANPSVVKLLMAMFIYGKEFRVCLDFIEAMPVNLAG